MPGGDRMTRNPNLIVVDLDAIPEHASLDLRTIYYAGILTSEVLDHLAHCAREREARDAEKLASMLGAPTISAFRELVSQ
ncbi:MAG: hypothetical protein JWM85_1658 [Acidimicrobiaceae bacterium]|nr:hypothetical protein [Acidimicrobiaceae bacterium]